MSDDKTKQGFSVDNLPDKESIERYINEQKEVLELIAKPKRLYTTLSVALFALAFCIPFVGAACVANGMLPALRLFNLVIISVMLVIIGLVVIFSGVRPMSRKFKKAQYAVQVLEDALEEGIYAEKFKVPELVDKESVEGSQLAQTEVETNGVAAVLTKNDSNQAMNEFFSIFERGVRNPLVPDTDEYRKLRHFWLALIIAGFVIMAVSLALLALVPSQLMLAGALLVLSYVILIGATVYDMKRLKPLRSAWARKSRMTEFEMRHNMRVVSQNRYKDQDES